MMPYEKLILDPCCGSRSIWFDKNNDIAIFGDVRSGDFVLCDGRRFNVRPELNLDFLALPFDDNSFRMVIFDPPHLIRAGDKSWMKRKYGVLKKDWKADIKQGFQECWRILKPEGVMIFKWNETQIKTADVLKVLPEKPLFGHTTNRSGYTIWMTFMKQ